ncbi:MAG: AMP nucleosidase, partial [Alphaproteobacteria bacterium]|nr:AMP nucleosidase [Alphaproteobacteria bacterium]
MAMATPAGAHSLKRFEEADAAVARITDIYNTGTRRVRERFDAFAAGDRETPAEPAYYPYVMIEARAAQMQFDARSSYGTLSYPGAYGTTLTRPDLFSEYYREQIGLLIENHGVPVSVGVSNRPIPMPFVIEHASADLSADEMQRVEGLFHMPDL